MSIFKRIKSFFGELFKKKSKSESKDKTDGGSMAYGIQVGGNQVTNGQLDPNGYGMSINNRKVDIDSAIKITHSRWIGNEEFSPGDDVFIRGQDLRSGNGDFGSTYDKVRIVNSTAFFTRSNIPSGSYGIRVGNSSMLSSDLLIARRVELRNLSTSELFDIYFNYAVSHRFKDKFFSTREIHTLASLRTVLALYGLVSESGKSNVTMEQFKGSLERNGLLTGFITYYELY